MNTSDLFTAISVLRTEIGWRWPVALGRSVWQARRLFSGTKWGRAHDDESAFVRRISLVAGIYTELTRRLGAERGLAITKRIFVALGVNEQRSHLRSLPASGADPMAHLMSFHDLMDQEGVPKFNQRRYVERSAPLPFHHYTMCLLGFLHRGRVTRTHADLL